MTRGSWFALAALALLGGSAQLFSQTLGQGSDQPAPSPFSQVHVNFRIRQSVTAAADLGITPHQKGGLPTTSVAKKGSEPAGLPGVKAEIRSITIGGKKLDFKAKPANAVTDKNGAVQITATLTKPLASATEVTVEPCIHAAVYGKRGDVCRSIRIKTGPAPADFDILFPPLDRAGQ